jgi:YebC/PmpR family DNA-binding regulatory protein
MSGHSHFKSIKRTKEAGDKKRGQIFSKLSREISLAAREGSNPDTNSKLRLVIEKAKRFNMPKENVERAIKRGSGEIEGKKLEEVLFEAYGPGGIAVIIEGITDNKNRALGEVKQVLNKNNGKLVGEGAIRWMFERKGVIEVRGMRPEDKKKVDLELMAIESGAEDVYWHDVSPQNDSRQERDTLYVYTKAEELEKVRKNLEEKGIPVYSASLDWVAKEEVSLNEKDKTACQKLFEELDELESVQEIYSNLAS